MQGPLQVRNALVTGASRGIGREIALRLAMAGALVCVHFGKGRAEADETVSLIGEAGGRYSVRTRGAARGVCICSPSGEGQSAGMKEKVRWEDGLHLFKTTQVTIHTLQPIMERVDCQMRDP